MNLKFLRLRQPYKVFCPKSRCYSISKSSNDDLTQIRNIGIMAHIDAGKTTTTERMLFYSGKIRQTGEVHHGNTVTDYMEQERERGITITSAAVSFKWKDYQFNLIDTPGHIDFTMEVEQTLSVLDGGVVVLDGSAGVEAQTITVWRQADRYSIPRIVFVNKMDRRDANLKLCCDSIEKKLETPALSIQLPIYTDEKLTGIIDVLTMEKHEWTFTPKETIKRMKLVEGDPVWEMAMNSRTKLIDRLSEHCDNLANTIINLDSLDDVKLPDLVNSLRKATIKRKVVPVVCGSAYKNIGIQPLMDSVILYLPSPSERSTNYACFENHCAARAFKVVHDKQKGALVFFRLYSGEFVKNQKIFNITQDLSEHTGRLYAPYADEFQEVPSITNGNIAVVSGLKQTITGDLISQSATVSQNAKKKMLSFPGITNEDVSVFFGIGNKVPEPVFFCSIEPPSLAYQSALDLALQELQREDASLKVTQNEETGQTVLAGMGELHLEIIKDRIHREYKVDADLGPLQIAYKEAPITNVKDSHTVSHKIGSSKHAVTMIASIIPTRDVLEAKDVLKLDKTSEASSVLAALHLRHILAVRQGVEVGLSHGPKIHSQVIKAQVMLHHLVIGKGTSDSIIAACSTQCIHKLLTQSGTAILEPIMILEIVTPSDRLSSIMGDLNRRRALIFNVALRGQTKVVSAEVPLAEMLGYSTILRTISSGEASFTMEFSNYRNMTSAEENEAIESVRGF